jgi:hydroxymethylpyrimidine pyrophosphatase-like HAD family hydrolase
MALPAGVDKATGAAAALDVLGIPPSLAVAIGDAENDVPLLQLCGLGVAVANALPEVQAYAHLVSDGAHGAGVIELIDALLATSSGKRGQRPF